MLFSADCCGLVVENCLLFGIVAVMCYVLSFVVCWPCLSLFVDCALFVVARCVKLLLVVYCWCNCVLFLYVCILSLHAVGVVVGWLLYVLLLDTVRFVVDFCCIVCSCCCFVVVVFMSVACC